MNLDATMTMPAEPHAHTEPAVQPETPPQPANGIVTVGTTPDDEPRREHPTPEGDALSPTRYGDWEQNGHCIDF